MFNFPYFLKFGIYIWDQLEIPTERGMIKTVKLFERNFNLIFTGDLKQVFLAVILTIKIN